MCFSCSASLDQQRFVHVPYAEKYRLTTKHFMISGLFYLNTADVRNGLSSLRVVYLLEGLSWTIYEDFIELMRGFKKACHTNEHTDILLCSLRFSVSSANLVVSVTSFCCPWWQLHISCNPYKQPIAAVGLQGFLEGCRIGKDGLWSVRNSSCLKDTSRTFQSKESCEVRFGHCIQPVVCLRVRMFVQNVSGLFLVKVLVQSTFFCTSVL